jgi:hypothetical protein
MPFVLTSADLSVGSSVTTCRPRRHTIRKQPPRYIGTIVPVMVVFSPLVWIETSSARPVQPDLTTRRHFASQNQVRHVPDLLLAGNIGGLQNVVECAVIPSKTRTFAVDESWPRRDDFPQRWRIVKWR